MIKLKKDVYIISSSSVVGMEEAAGPLGKHFELSDNKDDTFGCKTWEKAESEMQRLALGMAMSRAGLYCKDIDMLFAGDLQNQCVGSAYGLLSYDIPYIGLYGACSTAAEGLLLSSLVCSGCAPKRCAAVASSHNASSERQFRFPMEYGGQRSPTAQWTVTGAAAFISSSHPEDISRLREKGSFAPRISEALPGRSLDSGITDITNMGAAMAPAAADTLIRYFEKTGSLPADHDLILTGDLGYEGSVALRDIMRVSGFDIEPVHNDCGILIYDRSRQDKHSGGSGCGCSAVVLSSYILNKLTDGRYKSVLFLGTGAMMSPTSLQQGLSIPGIAHLVRIEAEGI